MSSRRIAALEALFLMVAGLIVFRAVAIRLAAPPKLERLADRQFKTRITALPSRGVIYDRDGQGLALSIKVRSLYARPEALQAHFKGKSGLKRLARAIAIVLRIPGDKMQEKLLSKKSFIWIKRHLGEKEESQLKGLGLDRYGDGLGLAEESRRFYPTHDLAAHALGAVNIDGQGIEGLELYYDAILAGEQKRISSLKDAMGRSIFMDDKGILAFRHGQSLVLTLDKTIQYQAEKTLKNTADELGAKAGTAIVMEVESGEVLALANYPTFDPNSARSSSMDARRNRAATDIYEPGSTMKPLLAALALERGSSPDTQIYCERGRFKVGDRWISEAETHEKYEWLSLTDVIARSSNVGAAKLALSLGAEPVATWLTKLGLGARTGIDLPGEVSGLSEPQAEFDRGLKSNVKLANVGFGHGITVTPLQMASLYAAIANGGVWVQPRMVKKVLNDNGTVAHEFGVKTVRRVMTAETARKLKAMLEKAVKGEGTGVKAALEDWSVAGKTGTAQKLDPATKRYSKSKYISSFIGFAPARAPKLAVLVVLDEPTKRYYGGETAAPAFKEIMGAALVRLNVPTDLTSPGVLKARNELAVRSVENTTSTDEGTERNRRGEINENRQVRLPDMRGYTMREALKAVSPYPVHAEVLGSGILKEQRPGPEEWLDPNARVRLVFEP